MKSYEIPSNLLGSKSSEIRLWAISSTIWAPRPLSAPAQRSGCCLGPRAAPGDGRWGSNEPTITAWWCNNHLEKYESQLGWFFPYMKWKLKFMFQSTNCFLVQKFGQFHPESRPKRTGNSCSNPRLPTLLQGGWWHQPSAWVSGQVSSVSNVFCDQDGSESHHCVDSLQFLHYLVASVRNIPGQRFPGLATEKKKKKTAQKPRFHRISPSYASYSNFTKLH